MGADLQGIGGRIRQTRLDRRMTQQVLAEKAGISVSFLSNIECGKQSMDLQVLAALMDVLDVSADWLIRGVPDLEKNVAKEIEDELLSCTPVERGTILQLVRMMKSSLATMKDHMD